MNVKQIVGMVLLLFGLLALTNVIALPIATVHVVGVAPTIYGVGLKGNIYVMSTDISNPSEFPAGATYVWVVCEPGEEPVSAALVIDGSETWDDFGGFSESNGWYFALMKPVGADEPQEWTAMAGEHTFEITVVDAQGDTATKTVYGTAISAAPEGQFTINGQAVTPESEITVYTHDLNFVFEATSGGDLIDRVEVHIEGEGIDETFLLSETVADSRWEGSYTVPKDGTYICTGTVYTTSGDSIVLMSLTMPVGITEGVSMPQLLVGLSSIAVGALLVLKRD